MNIITKIKGLSYLDPRTLFGTVLYSLRRSAIERKYRRPKARREAVGKLCSVTPGSRGATFRFEAAELEVEFKAPDLIRVTWTPGVLPVPYALAKEDFGPVECRFQEDRDRFVLATKDLEVTVFADGAMKFAAGGKTLREDLPPLRQGEGFVHRSKARPDARHFGLGERTYAFDLSGGRFKLWNQEAEGSYEPGDDPLYLCIPVWVTVHKDGSLLTFFENSFRGEVSFLDPVETSFEGGALRFYLVPGPPDRALARYTELTGRPPLPPKWALGFHQSRWSYMNEAEVREVVGGFKGLDAPLSAIHLDIHYMEGHRVFTVDRKRFPDLKRLAQELEASGVKLVAIVDPGVKREEKFWVYQELRETGGYCKLPDGSPALALVWPGECVFPDFTDPKVREWWAGLYRFFVDNGIAGVWHDMNEPAAFAAWGLPTLPLPTRHAMDGRGGDHLEAHNLYALLEARAGVEGLLGQRPDARPFILSRSGWAGIQRYAWTWTGDSESNWWTLAQTIRMLLSLGLCGAPYTGADIGGFGGEPTPELYLRWFQAGAFMPFFRVHSAFFCERREPWRFDTETASIAARTIRLRYRLMPYFYTVAAEVARTGHPFCRPIAWPDAADPDLWAVDHEFLVGNAILVAPVLEEGARERTVVLPRGRWISLWDDGFCFDGPGKVTVPAPLERIPVFVRAGTVLPMEEDGGVVLHIWPSEEGQALGELYSDAGDGFGPSRLDRFTVVRDGNIFNVTRIGEGDYPLPERGFALRLRGFTPAQPKVDAGAFERFTISIV